MRTAKQLLVLLTKAYPPFKGANHAFVFHPFDQKLHVVLAFAPNDWKHITIDDEDLDRPAEDIFTDIATLLVEHPLGPTSCSIEKKPTPTHVFARRELLGAAIDLLRAEGFDLTADALQFGKEGTDPGDGHRCQLCNELCGGDRRHHCWLAPEED